MTALNTLMALSLDELKTQSKADLDKLHNALLKDWNDRELFHVRDQIAFKYDITTDHLIEVQNYLALRARVRDELEKFPVRRNRNEITSAHLYIVPHEVVHQNFSQEMKVAYYKALYKFLSGFSERAGLKTKLKKWGVSEDEANATISYMAGLRQKLQNKGGKDLPHLPPLVAKSVQKTIDKLKNLSIKQPPYVDKAELDALPDDLRYELTIAYYKFVMKVWNNQKIKRLEDVVTRLNFRSGENAFRMISYLQNFSESHPDFDLPELCFRVKGKPGYFDWPKVRAYREKMSVNWAEVEDADVLLVSAIQFGSGVSLMPVHRMLLQRKAALEAQGFKVALVIQAIWFGRIEVDRFSGELVDSFPSALEGCIAFDKMDVWHDVLFTDHPVQPTNESRMITRSVQKRFVKIAQKQGVNHIFMAAPRVERVPLQRTDPMNTAPRYAYTSGSIGNANYPVNVLGTPSRRGRTAEELHQNACHIVYRGRDGQSSHVHDLCDVAQNGMAYDVDVVNKSIIKVSTRKIIPANTRKVLAGLVNPDGHHPFTEPKLHKAYFGEEGLIKTLFDPAVICHNDWRDSGAFAPFFSRYNAPESQWLARMGFDNFMLELDFCVLNALWTQHFTGADVKNADIGSNHCGWADAYFENAHNIDPRDPNYVLDLEIRAELAANLNDRTGESIHQMANRRKDGLFEIYVEKFVKRGLLYKRHLGQDAYDDAIAALNKEYEGAEFEKQRALFFTNAFVADAFRRCEKHPCFAQLFGKSAKVSDFALDYPLEILYNQTHETFLLAENSKNPVTIKHGHAADKGHKKGGLEAIADEPYPVVAGHYHAMWVLGDDLRTAGVMCAPQKHYMMGDTSNWSHGCIPVFENGQRMSWDVFLDGRYLPQLPDNVKKHDH